MKNLMYCFILLLVASMYSCQAPEASVDMTAVKAELQALEEAFAASSNAKDAEAQMAYYAEDAISMPPNEAIVVGRAAILERTKEEMEEDGGEGSIQFEIVDIYASGNYATEVGKWVYTNSEGEESTGKFISVFEKRDGKYVCIRDIWNSDDDDDDDEDESDEDEEEGDDD